MVRRPRGDPAFAVTLRVRAGADEPAKTLLGLWS